MNWDEFFMRQVYLVASKSKDTRTKIGSVLVKDNRVISQGYNGICMSVNDNVPERHERPLKYLYFVHAEHNSILSCARFGISSLGATLYTQGIPCASCAQAIIQAGVYEVVVHTQWPNLTHSDKWVESIQVSITMFDEANIRIRWLDKELGLKGMLDGKEIFI
jgi:dCMP deaminase